MIDQYDFYAWLRYRGVPEEERTKLTELIELYTSETYGANRTGWRELC